MQAPDPDTTNHLLQYIPFIGLAVGESRHPSPIVTRLVESAIIGAVLLYGTVQVLGKDVEWLRDSVTELKADVKELRREVYAYEAPHGSR